MGAMVVIALTTVAAFAAVNGDARESGKDVARKQALAAAEAGVNEYLFAPQQRQRLLGEVHGRADAQRGQRRVEPRAARPAQVGHGAGRLDAVHDRAAARQRLLEVHARGQGRGLDDRSPTAARCASASPAGRRAPRGP